MLLKWLAASIVVSPLVLVSAEVLAQRPGSTGETLPDPLNTGSLAPGNPGIKPPPSSGQEPLKPGSANNNGIDPLNPGLGSADPLKPGNAGGDPLKPSGAKPPNTGISVPLGNSIKPPAISSSGKPTPLVLDLQHKGAVSFRKDAVAFDIYGTGEPVKVSWPSAALGFLALDLNGSGLIESGIELFGDATVLKAEPDKTAEHGFQALRQYDDHADGVIDQQDKIFKQLLIWVDRNGDGLSDASELAPLSAYGVEALELAQRESSVLSNDGQRLPMLVSVYRYADKDGKIKTSLLADLYFKIYEQ